jgi:hypothetical protein
MPDRPKLNTRLLDFPQVTIRFRCSFCPRGGAARLAACAAKYGAETTLGELPYIFIRPCPWQPFSQRRKRQKYGRKCGADIEGLDPDPDDIITHSMIQRVELRLRRR